MLIAKFGLILPQRGGAGLKACGNEREALLALATAVREELIPGYSAKEDLSG